MHAWSEVDGSFVTYEELRVDLKCGNCSNVPNKTLVVKVI